MPQPTPADALRLAINLLRDSAETRRMPSGEGLTDDVVRLHADAADVLEDALSELRSSEDAPRPASGS